MGCFPVNVPLNQSIDHHKKVFSSGMIQLNPRLVFMDGVSQRSQPRHAAPMVGMVISTSCNFNWYKTVVLPAASKPTITILRSCHG